MKVPAAHLLPLFLILLSLNLTAQEWPDTPESDGFVVDMAQMLTMDEADALNIKLMTWYDTSSYMTIIVTVNDLRGKEIREFAQGIMNAWGIGRINDDRVVLIVVKPRKKPDQLQMTIVANKKMMEHISEDALAKITRSDFMPDLLKERYYFGLHKGTDALIATLSGSKPAGRDLQKSVNEKPVLLTIALLILVLLLLLRVILIYLKGRR
jgi:uncharacterized protein